MNKDLPQGDEKKSEAEVYENDPAFQSWNKQSDEFKDITDFDTYSAGWYDGYNSASPSDKVQEKEIEEDEEYEFWNHIVAVVAAENLHEKVAPADVKGIQDWKKKVIARLKSEGFHVTKAHILNL